MRSSLGEGRSSPQIAVVRSLNTPGTQGVQKGIRGDPGSFHHKGYSSIHPRLVPASCTPSGVQCEDLRASFPRVAAVFGGPWCGWLTHPPLTCTQPTRCEDAGDIEGWGWFKPFNPCFHVVITNTTRIKGTSGKRAGSTMHRSTAICLHSQLVPRLSSRVPSPPCAERRQAKRKRWMQASQLRLKKLGASSDQSDLDREDESRSAGRAAQVTNGRSCHSHLVTPAARKLQNASPSRLRNRVRTGEVRLI
ncbi:uncharacterized protein B0H64DRAFT_167358 [Chaetomium fimeti]|uniref:Uncharacterized protein n=1 Tax=Chaetomium fimeti TaxID=1854472 RepID=A0AAE0HHH7_9PEZI|nr:hypothetical protein B0H64DRAFT_167358 [Chaetomium fimeti]